MTDTFALDALVLGGGIAGLWVARRLVDRGQVVALIERDALGAGQSMASQGIIHGGLKYALAGRLNAASEAISEAPARWRACMDGRGEIDLGAVACPADACWLWADAGLGGRLAALFASRQLRGRIEHTPRAQWPAFLASAPFEGEVHRLSEFVLDVPSLLRVLAAPLAPRTLRLPDVTRRIERTSTGFALRLEHCTLQARTLILTAGSGNEALLQHLGAAAPHMQRRPLHQVCVDTEHPHPVFGHCLTELAPRALEPDKGQRVPQESRLAPKESLRPPEPRLTITSHARPRGGWTWYLGGALATSGVARERDAQIAFARAELARLLPWIDLSAAAMRTLRIDRAEAATAQGQRPDTAFVHAQDGLVTAWPTKLALTPDLGDRVIASCAGPGADAAQRDQQLLTALSGLTRPALAPGLETLAA